MEIKPFTPPKLPLKKLQWTKILPYVGKAHEALAELNEILKSFEDPLSTLAFLKTQEAIDSVHAKNFPSPRRGLPQLQKIKWH